MVCVGFAVVMTLASCVFRDIPLLFFADAGGCISVYLLVYADHISGNSMYFLLYNFWH